MAIKLDSSKFVRNLVKGHKLAPHLDKSIGEGEFEWNASFGTKEPDTAFHPSGDCIPSPLALFGMAKKEEGEFKKPSAALRKTFQVGHFWHAYIQWLVVERLGFASWEEIELTHETRWADGDYGWARGAADIAPCHIPIHGDYLVDIKTMGAHDFKLQGLPGWCAGKYECQVNIYMDWFDLDKTLILCVSKDSPHDFKEFIFNRNQPLIDAIYDKWKLVKVCLDQDVEPPEDYNIELPLAGPRL